MALKAKALKEKVAKAKSLLSQIETAKEKALAEKEAKAKEIQTISKQMKTHGGVTMNKNQKSDLFLVKTLSSITGKPATELVAQYAKEKAIELTSDHADIANNVKSSDLILEFEAKDAELNFINRFAKVDMAGKAKLEIPMESEDFEIKHVAEGADAVEQTWDETLMKIETSRAAMSFKLTKELQSKSIVDQISYVRSKIATAVGRGLLEGIYNGQGSNSAQQDDSYSATKTGVKYAGLRALLSAASLTTSFGSAALDKDLMVTFLKAAGQMFAQRQSQYVLIVCLRDHQVLSDIVRGSGVTGVNANGPDSALYADRFMGVEVHQTSFLKSPVASGSGYGTGGFVTSTAANNDHSVILLINPSKVMWALDELEISSEFKPKSNSFEITANCQIGWSAHTAQLGRMGVAVGATIS